MASKWATRDDDEDNQPFMNRIAKSFEKELKLETKYSAASPGIKPNIVKYTGSFPEAVTNSNVVRADVGNQYSNYRTMPGTSRQPSSQNSQQQAAFNFNQRGSTNNQFAPQRGNLNNGPSIHNNWNNQGGGHNQSAPAYNNTGQSSNNTQQQFRSLQQAPPTHISYQGQFPTIGANTVQPHTRGHEPPIMRPQARYPQQGPMNGVQQSDNQVHQQQQRRGGMTRGFGGRGGSFHHRPYNFNLQRPSYSINGYGEPIENPNLLYVMCQWNPMHYYALSDIRGHEQECDKRPRNPHHHRMAHR